MLEIIAIVAAGAILGHRGVARTAKDILGLARGVTNVTLGVAEGVVERLERLAKATVDQAATAAERAKAQAELARLIRDNPQVVAALAEAAKLRDCRCNVCGKPSIAIPGDPCFMGCPGTYQPIGPAGK